MPRGMSRDTRDRIKEGVPDLDGPGSPVLIWSSPERVLFQLRDVAKVVTCGATREFSLKRILKSLLAVWWHDLASLESSQEDGAV